VADWLAFLAFHYDQKDLSGPGCVPGTCGFAATGKDKLSTFAVQGGVKVDMIPRLTLAFNGWYGQNTGNLLGHVVQIGPVAPSGANLDLASVSGYGAWGQAGFALGGPWSVWAFMGVDNPDWEDAAWAFGGTTPATAARVRNVNSAAMLAWREGPVVFGLEWLHSFTTYGYGAVGPNNTAPARVTTFARNANQVMLTADYFF